MLSIAAASVLATSALGQAGGLYLPDHGGPSNGTAQAGSAAVARNAETAWLNPAGMTRLEDTELMFSLMPFYLDFEFSPGAETTTFGNDGGQQGAWFPGGALYLAAPINDRLAIGFSVAAPAGLGLDPDEAWVGRTWMTETELIALNFEPSIGYKINDQWSIGGGLDIQYASFEQKITGPLLGRQLEIDGDNWEVGFSASLLWEPSETTRFGLRYRYEMDHDLDGDFRINTVEPLDVSTAFLLPMSLTLSAYHDFNDKFAMMADVGWTNWGAFERNEIRFNASGNAIELPRDFDDVWHISVGAHFRPADNWLLMAGAGYTSSAVEDDLRTPDLPVDEQIRASFGVEYKLNDRWTIGGNYTFLWLGDNEIDQTRPLGRRLTGDYDSLAHLFGLYASITF